MKRLSIFLAITAIFYSLAANAQIATLDAGNLIQTTISAEQSVTQTKQQIQQFQAQLQQLQNQIQNTTNPSTFQWDNANNIINQVLGEAMTKARHILLLIAIALFSFNALAQDSSSNILNNVTDQFQAQASNWGGIITGYATWLFWALCTISLVWTGGTLVLKRADIGEFFAEFIRFCVFFGFFLWLLQNAGGIGTSIINSLIQIGANASQTGASNPSAVMDIGFQIFYKVMQQMSVWSPVVSIIGGLLAGIILICIALIAANMTIMLCSAWILLYGGIIFLGFGGSRWTSEIAIHYYKTLIGIGASLMAMVLMIGIAQSLITQYYNDMSTGIQVNELATIMVVALILLALIHRVPHLIAGVISGASIGHSGIGAFSAGAAIRWVFI